jgi:signal peptidase I
MDPVSTTPGSQTPQPPPRAAAGATLSWLRDLCLSVFIAIVVILFLYQPVKVEGTSMMPTLINQERIFINKFIYRFGVENIRRGDMVVFLFPGDPARSYIKRVIGIPGDTVQVADGTVIVNGEALAESYVSQANRDHISMPETTIRPDQYFVLGDHRNSSNDSRSWGMVPRNFIYGKAVFVYWPLDRIGILH